MPSPMELDSPVPTEPVKTAPLSIDFLQIANDARNANGLRHQDYQRYRTYSSRRLHRLRKLLDHTHGKGKTFVPKEVTKDTVSDPRHLHILLFQSERAWSYAMDLKQQNKTDQDAHRQYHVVRRLRKAASMALQLEHVCELGENSKVDPRTSLSAQAYSALMNGYSFFEEQLWQEALDKLATARTIYGKLATAGTAHQEALCQSAIDDIDPNIRYCAYNLRLAGSGTASKDVDELMTAFRKKGKGGAGLDQLAAKIEDALSHEFKKKANCFTSVNWRGKSIPLKSEELAVQILRTNQLSLDADTKTTGILPSTASAQDDAIHLESFDALLAAYSDAEKVAVKAVNEDRLASIKVQSSKSEETTRNVLSVLSFVIYNRIVATVRRNLVLVGQSRKAIEEGEKKGVKASNMYMDVVRLFDVIIQTLSELNNLPANQDDAELQNAAQLGISYYKAWRCLYVSCAYANQSKHAESLALFERAREHLMKSSPPKYNRAEGIDRVILPEEGDIRELDGLIRMKKAQVHALWFLMNDAADERKATGEEDERPLICRLDTYPSSLVRPSDATSTLTPFPVPNLIQVPPAFTPVPAKPVFFDLAHGMIDMPVDAIAARAGKKNSGGIGGILGGWFGRK